MRLTYIGPHEEVEVLVRVKRGEQIDIPAGESLASQVEAWEVETEDLDQLTVAALRDRAEADGLSVPAKATKSELIDLIEKGA